MGYPQRRTETRNSTNGPLELPAPPKIQPQISENAGNHRDFFCKEDERQMQRINSSCDYHLHFILQQLDDLIMSVTLRQHQRRFLVLILRLQIQISLLTQNPHAL